MMAKTIQHRNKAGSVGGYTLIEMVLTVVVLSIIGLTSSKVIIESMKVYAQTAPTLDASYQAHLAVRHLQRDIRNMRDTSTITALTPTALTFDDVEGHTLEFNLTAGDLTRNGDLLARGVSSFGFRYFQQDGSVATGPGNLHLIEIDLTVQVADQQQRSMAVVFPRSLGL